MGGEKVQTEPDVKIAKGRIHNLTTLLTAQNYRIFRRYANNELTIYFYRGSECHTVTLGVTENPNLDYFIYVNSDITNEFMTNVVNKHLGLSLKLDYMTMTTSLDNAQQSVDTLKRELRIEEAYIEKSPKQLILEMDYHLMELHEHMQVNDHEQIDNVKNKLAFLHRQLFKQ
jgi:hypothetical protein